MLRFGFYIPAVLWADILPVAGTLIVPGAAQMLVSTRSSGINAAISGVVRIGPILLGARIIRKNLL